jgi:transcription elongation GreA/GreB family factor
MSVAFVREESAETAAEVVLPDRPVSSHPNLVTSSGLETLRSALAETRAAYEAAQTVGDLIERRRVAEPALRDMRYFSERVQSAQLIAAPQANDAVAFGHSVTFLREDRRRQTFRIVGEDEADPRNGTISYVSPVARALMNKRVGEVASMGGRDIEIVAIGE